MCCTGRCGPSRAARRSAPGGLVDVTEAGERDSDVLYAFPPTAGRHAKATRP